MTNVLILGGGTAGTLVANKLRASAPASELQITVVDRDDKLTDFLVGEGARRWEHGSVFVAAG